MSLSSMQSRLVSRESDEDHFCLAARFFEQLTYSGNHAAKEFSARIDAMQL